MVCLEVYQKKKPDDGFSENCILSVNLDWKWYFKIFTIFISYLINVSVSNAIEWCFFYMRHKKHIFCHRSKVSPKDFSFSRLSFYLRWIELISETAKRIPRQLLHFFLSFPRTDISFWSILIKRKCWLFQEKSN